MDIIVRAEIKQALCHKSKPRGSIAYVNRGLVMAESVLNGHRKQHYLKNFESPKHARILSFKYFRPFLAFMILALPNIVAAKHRS
jgi:hypothetical protein